MEAQDFKDAVRYAELEFSTFSRTKDDVIPSPFPDTTTIVTKQTIGVCGIVAPWNFSIAMITRKIAPAIAAGCTVVVKPPSETLLCALALAKLALEAGLPPNVMQVSFIGSTKVGKAITEKVTMTMKKISMELGGSAPFIVFEDADIKKAIAALMGCKFRCSGQTCICANRVFVQRPISDTFIFKLKGRMQSLKAGSPFDPTMTNGPLMNKAAVATTLRLIGLQRYHTGPLITGIKPGMALAHEEIFGTIAPVITFDKEEEVVEISNNTEFGLAGYFVSYDYRRIWSVAKAL
ncbi:uncharacterized protein Z519_12185 [Cladophialophora bantiana CBS 173.52]|uniref:Succinate-semialdehyde dehydrogenase, mitochondrial n=1 Tax=Cladophialophora bantiana (strain ATCC 10958 / CBS 173.52 / CDC B-1940 / NIH 8579) TaxID=1442370 RepID=A0A0D2FKR2_CLAB1|nr:uncharacterized protein Z519_12185 [Cladophialophora bantiana CBS 173.52]KIW87282.1 hypothetical protein Z519_12185 [Cladophialophora bantiana CBS 173.52]